VLIEWRGISILVDPLIPSGSGGEPRYSFSDLPARIDYVLITHGHDDHYELSSLLRSAPDRLPPRSEGNRGAMGLFIESHVQRIGFKHVIEFDAFDSMTPGPDMEFVSIPFHGEHGELFAAKTCWLVRLGTEQMLSRQTPIRLTLAPTRASGRSPETSKPYLSERAAQVRALRRISAAVWLVRARATGRCLDREIELGIPVVPTPPEPGRSYRALGRSGSTSTLSDRSLGFSAISDPTRNLFTEARAVVERAHQSDLPTPGFFVAPASSA